MSHKQSANTSHRKTLARQYASLTGLTYQQALNLVATAAEAGALPTPLDPEGMSAAIQVLIRMDGPHGATHPSRTKFATDDTRHRYGIRVDLDIEARSYGRLVARLIESRWPEVAKSLRSVRVIDENAERLAWQVHDLAAVFTEGSIFESHMTTLVRYWEHLATSDPDSDNDHSLDIALVSEVREQVDNLRQHLDKTETVHEYDRTQRRPEAMEREDYRLLALAKQDGGTAWVQGMTECRAALRLAEKGKVVIEAPDPTDPVEITTKGGAGVVRLTTPDPSPSKPDPALGTNHAPRIAVRA